MLTIIVAHNNWWWWQRGSQIYHLDVICILQLVYICLLDDVRIIWRLCIGVIINDHSHSWDYIVHFWVVSIFLPHSCIAAIIISIISP